MEARVLEHASEYLYKLPCHWFIHYFFVHSIFAINNMPPAKSPNLYHGIPPYSLAELTDSVHGEFVYPSQLQLSKCLPPLPLAQTKMLPFPWRPLITPWRKARVVKRPGLSNVWPSSSGPQLWLKTVITITSQELLGINIEYKPCRVYVNVVAIERYGPCLSSVCYISIKHPYSSYPGIVGYSYTTSENAWKLCNACD